MARPTEGEKISYLSEHLEGARSQVCSFLKTMQVNKTTGFLLEIAAVSHDVGKAHHDWQRYIRGKTSSNPNHAKCGAIFFAYLAYHFLQNTGLWEQHQFDWLFITRDIADHHGILKGFVENEGLSSNSFVRIDMAGLANWLYEVFPEMREIGIGITAECINDWQNDYEDIVTDTIYAFYDREEAAARSLDEQMDVLQQWRNHTAKLIAADRFDIEHINDMRFAASDWLKIAKTIRKFCNTGKDCSLNQVRSRAQKMIMAQWEQNRGHSFYVLEMPTGYGKTVTALKLANAIAREGFSKIIYVAPYLSILEQNAGDISNATGYQSMQHHSMALLGAGRKKHAGPTSEEKILDENENTDKFSDLFVQSWANPIVCTSFVQMMKAVFPRRAQETLRRVYLHNAIIIIDEPQIMDAAVWNLFLKGLASLERICNLKVIFCSATMPPFTYGLLTKPTKLMVQSCKSDNRYQIKVVDPIDAEGCVQRLNKINEPSSAVIVNTIYDACNIFELLPQHEEIERYLLHGLMVPLHKKMQIEKIKRALEEQQKGLGRAQVQVISTQILEAGVNLSFQYMYRALPILPSLTQAAGRVNRHKEKDEGMGTIETGKLLRNGKDTRYIYSSALCRLSDEIIFQKDIWLEEEMGELVTTFYQRMFTENSYEAVLQDIEKAMAGDWKVLSRHEVFDSKEYYRLPLFVPFDWIKNEGLLDKGVKFLLEEFGFNSPWDIYELFIDKTSRQSWTYEKRKKFNILFNQFVLQVPAEKALKLAAKEDFLQKRIPIIMDDKSYDAEKGLRFLKDEIGDSFI